jgi:hypothetical protein
MLQPWPVAKAYSQDARSALSCSRSWSRSCTACLTCRCARRVVGASPLALNTGAEHAGISARTRSLVHAVDRRASVHNPNNADATNSAVAAARPKARGVGPRRRWQGSTRCARPPLPEILRSRVAFSTGYCTGRRNAHVIREDRAIGGRCHHNEVQSRAARRPAADGCRASEPSPPPTCRGLASAQETTREGHARSPLVRHGHEIAVDRRDLRALPRSKSSSNPRCPPRHARRLPVVVANGSAVLESRTGNVALGLRCPSESLISRSASPAFRLGDARPPSRKTRSRRPRGSRWRSSSLLESSWSTR